MPDTEDAEPQTMTIGTNNVFEVGCGILLLSTTLVYLHNLELVASPSHSDMYCSYVTRLPCLKLSFSIPSIPSAENRGQ